MPRIYGLLNREKTVRALVRFVALWFLTHALRADPPSPFEPPYSSYQFPLPYLTNLSGRAQLGEGENVMIAGLVADVSGLYPAMGVLLRGVGPSLKNLGIVNAVEKPVLTLFDAHDAPVAKNDRWWTDPRTAFFAELLGAFPLGQGSDDAAMFQAVPDGRATVILENSAKTGGIGLVEIYQALEGTIYFGLRNLSLRARTGPGEQTAIAGFVFTDPKSEGRYARFLLRAAGPSLAQQGVAHPIENPVLTVYDAKGTIVAMNDDWSASDIALNAAVKQVGAFPFNEGSHDAALLIDLPAGVYSMHATGGEGVVLLEVYQIPMWP